jgi:hypothetical protein
MAGAIAKVLHAAPMQLKRPRRVEIEKVNNGFLVTGSYNEKTGTTDRWIAATEEEAKKLASKIL